MAATAACRVMPSTYSMTRNGGRASGSTSMTWTTFGCWMAAAARASRVNRFSATGSATSSGVSTLTATRFRRAVCSARYTVPMPPAPILSSSR